MLENKRGSSFVDLKKRLGEYVEGRLDNLPTKPHLKIPTLELTEKIPINHDQISSVEFFKFRDSSLRPRITFGMFLNHRLQETTEEKPEVIRITTVIDFSTPSLLPDENVITTIIEKLQPSTSTLERETGGSYELALSVLFSLHERYPEQFPDPRIILAPQ